MSLLLLSLVFGDGAVDANICYPISMIATVYIRVSERQGRCLGKGGGMSWRLENCSSQDPRFQEMNQRGFDHHHCLVVGFACTPLDGNAPQTAIHRKLLPRDHVAHKGQGTRRQAHASTTSADEIWQASSKNCLASVRSMRSL